MKLTIEPTEEFFMADDVMVRMWQGTDDEGTPVVALVCAVMFSEQAKATVSELNLVSIPPPTPAEAQAWAKLVLNQPTDLGTQD